jgi:DNA-binding MarR family transcriptional regulator
MTGKLDRLEHQGLIQRTPHPDDRRAVTLSITANGRTMVDEAFDTSLSVYQSMLENLSPGDLDNIETILEELLTRLEQLSAI